MLLSKVHQVLFRSVLQKIGLIAIPISSSLANGLTISNKIIFDIVLKK